jgi:hypothetical protein
VRRLPQNRPGTNESVPEAGEGSTLRAPLELGREAGRVTVNFTLVRRCDIKTTKGDWSGVRVEVVSELPLTRATLLKICWRLLTAKLELSNGNYR